MGQLPAVRRSPARAFLHMGADYAGPFPILKWRLINAQPSIVHITVFVCFSTSAVHLELASRQTTQAFIGAYKRFTERRGIPEVMYSNNATTFVGASGVLNKLYNQESRENQQIQAALATNGTQWNFSPPRAPHFGGKWEAVVKSANTSAISPKLSPVHQQSALNYHQYMSNQEKKSIEQSGEENSREDDPEPINE
ncbi:uncharacterized protein LOC107042122 [Diachasma alloeum]|uniref:uncharacterized protein LOC107042122 n=1 Tax=Diachasma alloeum TaxID=454923 RepID=UPI0007383FA6|nr:uncharacterized protein LOC107042122 [Diachasma alloeum]